MKKSLWIKGMAMLAMLSLAACATVQTATTLATAVGEQAGVLSHAEGESIRKSTVAVARSLEDFTPEQEYYIGRSVGAVVLSKYPAYTNAQVNQYLNMLGQTLAAASDKPQIFGGYHFLVLDSDDINAFATPSGLVFVTRGLIRCCPTEDALAAVLSHEIGHVQLRHGMQSIEKARVTEALTVIATEGAKTLGSPEVAQLTETFSGAISDIAKSMINNGYSRSFEYQADETAVILLQRVGYNPRGLIDMLTVMEKKLKPGGFDFAKTHPAPRDRIAEIQGDNLSVTPVATPKIRQERFLKAVGNI
jgi:predicted Zn-dependent protease